MRGGSSKTRIETLYYPLARDTQSPGMRGGSSKTRIETIRLIPVQSPYE